MNWSAHATGCSTHLKIVAIGSAMTLLISVMGIVATVFNRGDDIMTAHAPTAIKAGASIIFTDQDNTFFC